MLKPVSAIEVLKSRVYLLELCQGAPKVRAMEIIDELEPIKSSIYGGQWATLGWNGEMDTAIAIRTAVTKDGVCMHKQGRSSGFYS